LTLSGAKILVTGGAGFIGSHIVDDLVESGAEVTIFDNFSTGNTENLEGASAKVEVVEGDITDASGIRDACVGMDFVSHQAAQLEIFRSTDDPVQDLEVNTIGTLNVLDGALRAGVGKVVAASSACVYGQTDGATDETSMPVPNWTYGVSKLAAERYCTIYNEYRGLPTVSLRYGIVYGEREWYRRVLTIFIKRAVERESLVVFGDGTQARDFVHVSDVVKMNRACMSDDRANGHVFNVGTGIGTTVNELAELVVAECVPELPITREDVAEGEFSQLVPDKRRNHSELQLMLLDSSLAERVLDWKPVKQLSDGVREEYEWLLNNPQRFQSIKYTETEVDSDD
jgi:UDP-glucose 4-epimerase